jgi:UDP-N-acetylmuramoylalanine--D-glutamate ligase
MQTLQVKTVLVVGLGESGLAMAAWLARQNIQVRVVDTRSAPPQLAVLAVCAPNAVFIKGGLTFDALQGVDELVLSPGLSPYHEPLKAFLTQARLLQIAVLGEIDLFIQALDALAQTQQYHPKILAITGTNGKTTTTMLTHHMLSAAGVAACVAGNVSPSMLDALMAHQASESLPEVWVLELSSFQLDAVNAWRADAAVVLNVTEDHLDWHEDMSAYAAAKAKIFSTQTIQVLNRDDALVAKMALPQRRVISFGADQPTKSGDLGVLTQDEMAWLVLAVDDNLGQKQRRSNELLPLRFNLLMPVDALQIKGLHNATNALAALALCQAIDVPLAQLLHGLRTYRGEPHRMELVATVNEVDFIDDSKGTNVGATIAALRGLTQPVVLIAGGDGKGQSFEPLIAALSPSVKAVCLIGKDGSQLKTLCDASAIPAEVFDDLPAATQAAFKLAAQGDMVLLSPACASLDMFKNYKHRAEVFVDAVQEIAFALGQPC